MKVFSWNGQDHPFELERIRCTNESAELQNLLHRHAEFLPGEQISPDDPCRWLLIKREMPVDDPLGGGNRWSVDFLFADQQGKPTFVECKRFSSTQSRREVVGQMLEYAANGHFYWTAEVLREYAEASAKTDGDDLQERLDAIEPETGESIDDYFDRVHENLREGQLRLVFFLEEAPLELKSIVDFLNRQMERSEVLIVEARQFLHGEHRLIIPHLFGYTEEARRIKRTLTVSSQDRLKWEESSYFEKIREDLGVEVLLHFRKIYKLAEENGLAIRWGTGKKAGSFSIVIRSLCPRSLITVFTDGALKINMGWFDGRPATVQFMKAFSDGLRDILGQGFPAHKKYPEIPLKTWIKHADDLLDYLSRTFQSANRLEPGEGA